MSRKTLLVLGSTAAVVALPLLDPLTRARVLNGVLFQQGVWIVVGALLILTLCWGIVVLEERSSRLKPSQKSAEAVDAAEAADSTEPAPTAAGTTDPTGRTERVWVPFAAAAAIVVMAVAGYFLQQWDRHTTLRDTVAIADVPVPAMGMRAPYLVAERQASSNLSGTVGNIGETDYLPASDTYSTLVNRPGPLNPGYEAIVSQQLALTGNADSTMCRFSEQADQRMGGFLWNSLERGIAAHDFMLIAKEKDAWGYCDGDTPMVVVPLTKLHTWLSPVDVPAGVAVYNGGDGVLEVRDSVEAGALPGPVVSISHAERINASLATFGGTWWSSLIGQSGLTDQPKDEDDTNISNASNFSLAVGPDKLQGFVSPFTSRASSRTIDHVGVVDSSRVAAGNHAGASLHTLATPRQSNAATADGIKSTYASMPGWAAGMAVMEIVPGGGEEVWQASIGQKQNVNYRVELLADGTSCLLTATGTKLSCSDGEGTTEAVGGTGTPIDADADPSELTDEQLVELHEAVVEEIHRRLAG